MVAIAMKVNIPMITMLERSRNMLHPVLIAVLAPIELSVPAKLIMTPCTSQSNMTPAKTRIAPPIVRNQDPSQLINGNHIQFSNQEPPNRLQESATWPFAFVCVPVGVTLPTPVVTGWPVLSLKLMIDWLP